MVYVTDRRVTTPIVKTGTTRLANGVIQSQAQTTISSLDQTTYSWRSASRNSSEEEGLFQSTSGKYTDFLRDLKKSNDITYDHGHEFWTTRQEFLKPGWCTAILRSSSSPTASHTDYHGPIQAPIIGGNEFPPVSYPTIGAINADGTRGIDRSLPTKIAAGLTQSLLELRQDLPHVPLWNIWRSRGGVAQKAGGEFLNWEFGIQPTAGDVTKLALAVRDRKIYLDRLKQEANAQVRRKVLVYDTSSIVERGQVGSGLPLMQSTPGFLSPAASFYSQGGRTLATDTYRQRCWLSSAFEYVLWDMDTLLDRQENLLQRIDHLLGIGITPDTVYQLTRWSWLLDWVSNFGSVVRNFTAFCNLDDRLTMKYAYVMHTTYAQRTFVFSGAVLRANVTAPTSVTQYSSMTKKERHRASPFGFGLNVSGFSSKQWAILGALGLSRGHAGPLKLAEPV